MITKRIIPCLDVKDGRVVKGTNFVNLRDAGDPVEAAKMYSDMGADEIVFLDITATHEHRKTIADIVEKTAREVFVPLTVGGGIVSIDNMREILRAGADKIGINSAAVKNKNLITEGAEKFGSQCIVVAIDAKSVVKNTDDENDNIKRWHVFINGGRIDTGLDTVKWAKEAESLGAGEILLTSMDADGTKDGFDILLTKTIAESVNIPVIASGGCGKLEHFRQVFEQTEASAALAASVFHYKETDVQSVKNYLRKYGIPVRLL